MELASILGREAQTRIAVEFSAPPRWAVRVEVFACLIHAGPSASRVRTWPPSWRLVSVVCLNSRLVMSDSHEQQKSHSDSLRPWQ